MRHGATFYVRLANGATDFVGRYSSDDTLPLAIFDQKAVASAVEAHASADLASSSHPLAAVLRDSDLGPGHSFFVCSAALMHS